MANEKINPAQTEEYEDKFSVELFMQDKRALGELVEKYVLDLVHAEEKGKEGVQATVYATQRQITALENANVQLSVGENQSEIGRQRQKEVSKEDRFQGGKIPPKGLGGKR